MLVLYSKIKLIAPKAALTGDREGGLESPLRDAPGCECVTVKSFFASILINVINNSRNALWIEGGCGHAVVIVVRH